MMKEVLRPFKGTQMSRSTAFRGECSLRDQPTSYPLALLVERDSNSQL